MEDINGGIIISNSFRIVSRTTIIYGEFRKSQSLCVLSNNDTLISLDENTRRYDTGKFQMDQPNYDNK